MNQLSARAHRVAGVLASVAMVSVIVLFHVFWHPPALNFAYGFYLLFAGAAVWFVWLASRAERPWNSQDIAPGRVVAVVPSFNEDEVMLHRCVRSLLEGTIVPDVIHVIDDGSRVPVVGFEHPRVQWHRQENKGKRAAQVAALAYEQGDYLVTVDSDSIVGKDALEKSLRAMSDPAVQGVTVTVAVENRDQNLLTKLTDFEIVYGCLLMRGARSYLGAVAPTAGTFAVYRWGIFGDNISDYLSSGTAGDDRRLTHYALKRGRVIAIDDAVVHTLMPDNLPEMFQQRTRWFKSYWRYWRWEVVNLDGPALYLRVWATLLTVLYPVIIMWALVISPLMGGPVYWQAFVYWALIMFAQTSLFLTGHPTMNRWERIGAWLLYTPLVTLLNLVVIRPAMYLAVFKARTLHWQTRSA